MILLLLGLTVGWLVGRYAPRPADMYYRLLIWWLRRELLKQMREWAEENEV